jgi:uncharacterized protein YbjT (DUF2867 family)
MRIAVTGANGSVGRNLLTHLAERGDPCVAIVRSERAARELQVQLGVFSTLRQHTERVMSSLGEKQQGDIVDMLGTKALATALLIEIYTGKLSEADIEEAARKLGLP